MTMNISEVSIQLHELSDDYSKRRITLDEYRSKRKFFLDDIDQIFNNQSYAKMPQNIEETRESNDKDNIIPEAIYKVFESDKK